MYSVILVRYGEMTLKKKNYIAFLKQMNNNIRSRLRYLDKLTFSHTGYRFYIHLNGEAHEKVVAILNTVVGLYSYSLCVETTNTIDDIVNASLRLIASTRTSDHFSFKVDTHRSDKSYPLTSLEISQAVAHRVVPQIPGIKVDVHHPDVTLSIDLRREGVYLYSETIKGLGGYPSGVAGNGLLMISGGIDSPVAGFLAIKKGVNLSAIHFSSPPYTSDLALQKVVDLLKQLALYTTTGSITLFNVHFTHIQNRIYEAADPAYVITLMRRAMYKIASRYAKAHHIHCLINGESIGQVASQTLESMMVINEVTNLLVLRPLISYDKEDIIHLAKKIDTFNISIKPYDDCCTIFVPEHPIIKPRLRCVLSEEKKCNLDVLLEEAFQSIQTMTIEANSQINVFSEDDKFNI